MDRSWASFILLTATLLCRAYGRFTGQVLKACHHGRPSTIDKDKIKLALKDMTTAKIDEIDTFYGRTCLMTAAEEGRLDVVNLLIAHGAYLDLKSTITGWTALHFAASTGDFGVVKALLSAGARTDIRVENYGTPAELARFVNKPDIANLIDNFVAAPTSTPVCATCPVCSSTTSVSGCQDSAPGMDSWIIIVETDMCRKPTETDCTHAGTDGKVSIQIEGGKGKTNWTTLTNGKANDRNLFKDGRTDVFTFKSLPVGVFERVSIQHRYTTAGDSWKCKEVVVHQENKDSGLWKTLKFNCSWIKDGIKVLPWHW